MTKSLSEITKLAREALSKQALQRYQFGGVDAYSGKRFPDVVTAEPGLLSGRQAWLRKVLDGFRGGGVQAANDVVNKHQGAPYVLAEAGKGLWRTFGRPEQPEFGRQTKDFLREFGRGAAMGAADQQARETKGFAGGVSKLTRLFSGDRDRPPSPPPRPIRMPAPFSLKQSTTKSAGPNAFTLGGGAVGAGLGALSGHDEDPDKRRYLRNALLGAGIGGLAGAGVDYLRAPLSEAPTPPATPETPSLASPAVVPSGKPTPSPTPAPPPNAVAGPGPLDSAIKQVSGNLGRGVARTTSMGANARANLLAKAPGGLAAMLKKLPKAPAATPDKPPAPKTDGPPTPAPKTTTAAWLNHALATRSKQAIANAVLASVVARRLGG